MAQSQLRPESSWDPTWERVFREQPWGQYPPEHVVRFVARKWYSAADRSGVRLLDLGCGPGACTWYMARERFSVSGIDGSETAIDLARHRLAHEGLVADLHVGNFAILPWPEGVFDGVIDNFALCHNRFEDCRRAVREAYRVMKPGGCLLSCSFSARTLGCGAGTVVERGGYKDITVGPLAGKGFCLFMTRNRVAELFRDFAVQEIELVSRTVSSMQHLIEFWCVEAHKPC